MKIDSELNAILKTGDISTLYQPIVQLNNGEVIGYEALSRGPKDSPLFFPDMLFNIAEHCNMLWELELLCRTKALEGAISLDKSKYLFINVSPSIIRDSKFKQNFSKEFIGKNNIVPLKIIFEITEKTSIGDYISFKDTLNNYIGQDYTVPINQSNSNLTNFTDLEPHFIKIDMKLIRGIDTDSFNQSIIKNFVSLSESTGTKLIAEGIETEAELRTLIELKVYAGQGFFLQSPVSVFNNIPKNIYDLIININGSVGYSFEFNKNRIGQIASKEPSFIESVSCRVIKDYFSNSRATGACIINSSGVPVGLLMEHTLNSMLATQYGNAIFYKRPASIVMNRTPLIVDYTTPISTVSKVAMQRDDNTLYDYVIVTKDKQYSGIVTIKKLLEYTTTMETNYAKELNPLTGLPGNAIIFSVLRDVITSCKNHCVLYFDLNNFKTYNDTYGFENGDKVIKFTANLLEKYIKGASPFNSFVGHIGGDDFIAILQAPFETCIDVCKNFNNRFDHGILQFFNKTDRENRYILATDRKGNKDIFGLTSMSVAGMYGNFEKFSDEDSISQYITYIKKQVKAEKKSAYFIENLNFI